MGRAAASSGTGGARPVFPLRLHLLPRHQPHLDSSSRDKSLNCILRVVATVTYCLDGGELLYYKWTFCWRGSRTRLGSQSPTDEGKDTFLTSIHPENSLEHTA